ncbi:type VII secretion protein EccB [Nocardia sp. BMG111209]|uniref:type VII secretion protein EccB n=1 Tax=Nocardia sp. BMG111209 TaxID=1160137 RepID=UPI00036ED50D|nr:type VII secretion protein EccB [Nocardia sp. BMG111209]
MPTQLTTRAQVNGYRFLLDRYEHALVRRDIRMLHDPMRTQFRSLVIGAVLGVLVVAGAAILAFLRPQGSIGDAKIVMGKQSGALYVIVDGTLHPVLNLASARLIVADPASPTPVGEAKLTMPRGPLLGIPGAPAALPGSADAGHSTWTLCDTVQGSPAATTGVLTTAVVGSPGTGGVAGARPMGAGDAFLATHAGHTYLLFAGRRAELDPGDPVLIRSLGLRTATARPIGAALLDTAEPVPALQAPHIDDVGTPGPGKLSGIPVGAVVRVHRVDTDELYVVLTDGVQRVSPFAAEVIRNANSQNMTDVTTVPPDRIVGIAVVNRLPVDKFPGPVPRIVPADTDPVGCVSWSRSADDPAGTLTLLAGRRVPVPGDGRPVRLATADGAGDRVDEVYVRPGTGEYVQSVGAPPGSIDRGPLFYLADNGIRYGIPDRATAAALGLAKDPKPAPAPILEALTPGPTLARPDALTSHDSLPQCPNPADHPGACAKPIPAPAEH